MYVGQSSTLTPDGELRKIRAVGGIASSTAGKSVKGSAMIGTELIGAPSATWVTAPDGARRKESTSIGGDGPTLPGKYRFCANTDCTKSLWIAAVNALTAEAAPACTPLPDCTAALATV